MFSLTLKGLLAHKLRFALTGVAVILGVAFMAGTLVLTDTVGKSFDDLFKTNNQGIDAVVVRHESQDHRGMAWPEVASDRELPGTFDLREEMGRRGLL